MQELSLRHFRVPFIIADYLPSIPGCWSYESVIRAFGTIDAGRISDGGVASRTGELARVEWSPKVPSR